MTIYSTWLKVLSEKITQSKKEHELSNDALLHLKPSTEIAEVLELLPPGSFAILENQPCDLPPFQVINCKGGRYWVRQQSWGKYVHWEVEHYRLKSA